MSPQPWTTCEWETHGWWLALKVFKRQPRERKECGASVYARCLSLYKSTATKDTRQAIVCIRYMWPCTVLYVVFKIVQYPVKWPVRSPVEQLMGELHYVFHTSLHIIKLQRWLHLGGDILWWSAVTSLYPPPAVCASAPGRRFQFFTSCLRPRVSS